MSAGHRGGDRENGRYHHSNPERVGHLLEREERTAHRRRERNGETCSAERGLHDADIVLVESGTSSGLRSDRRTHVHRRPLTAEDQTGSDRGETTEEPRRDHPQRRRSRFSSFDGLHMLDSAARRGRYEVGDERAEGRAGRRHRDRDEPSRCAESVGPLQHLEPPPVEMVEAPPERAAQDTGHTPGEDGEHAQPHQSLVVGRRRGHTCKLPRTPPSTGASERQVRVVHR